LAKSQKFRPIDKDRMAQFPPLGLEIPEDHPGRNKYFSMTRRKQLNSSDLVFLDTARESGRDSREQQR
jgi:hypothetical protein